MRFPHRGVVFLLAVGSWVAAAAQTNPVEVCARGTSPDDVIAACTTLIERMPALVNAGRLPPSDLSGAYHNRALGFARKGDTDAALKDAAEAIRINPQNANAYVTRGNQAFARREYEKAIGDYSEAIKLNPQYVTAYYNRGNAWLERGENDRAISDYSEVLRIDPAYQNASINRDIARQRKSSAPQTAANESDCSASLSERLIAGCTKVLERDPAEAGALLNRGKAFIWLRGDFENAIADTRKALGEPLTDHGLAIAYSNLGLAYLGQHKYDLAVRAFDESIRRSQEKISVELLGRGIARMRTGDASGAQADFAQAKTLVPDIVKTWSTLWSRFDKSIALAPSEANAPASAMLPSQAADCKAAAAAKETINGKVVNKYVESELLSMGCPGRYTPPQRR